MQRKEGLLFRVLFAAIACSMAVTEGLLVWQGRWQEAIPLHLCSLSAIAAAALALHPGHELLDFLWYLGMPGAALALAFPAPASSVCQALLDASYYTTHALILVIPTWRMAAGMRPRKGKTPVMMLTLLGIAVMAQAVNRRLGTDFLFLMAPPAGTPLEWIFARGYPVYLAALFILMLLCCMGMDALAGRIGRWTMKNGKKQSVTGAHFKLYKSE